MDTKKGMAAAACVHVWAKDPLDPYPLLPHLLDTTVVMGHLWDRWLRPDLRALVASRLGLDPETARNAALLSAGLHDIGKANPFFQLQERRGDLASSMAALRTKFAGHGLPVTNVHLAAQLRSDGAHALRRHEYVTFRAIAGIWPQARMGFLQQHWLAAIDGGHHGYWRSTLSGDNVDWANLFCDPAWDAQQRAHLALVTDILDLHPRDLPPLPENGLIALVVISGLLTLSDWLASDADVVARGKALIASGIEPYANPAAWLKFRADELAEHTTRCLGEPNTYTSADLHRATLGDYQPRPLQREALALTDTDPTDGSHDDAGTGGLWVCMYPTGEGKSEATLLRHGLRPHEGFLFALPTRATTDAMERRIGQWLRTVGTGVIKSHQFAGAEQLQSAVRDPDTCCDLLDTAWFTSSIRKLVAPHVVMTCDQVLTGALRQRHATLRLLALANHHVVIDEVHTFDAYQQALLVELLAWWGATRTRVTLLSATLPRAQLEALVSAYRGSRTTLPEVPFPGHVHAPADPDLAITIGPEPTEGPQTRPIPTASVDLVDAESREARIQSHIDWAVGCAAAHPRSPIGLIVNVVDDCCSVAVGIQESLARRGVTTHDVDCLHSRMTQTHRTQKETALLERIGKPAHAQDFANQRPLIVVGTQVLQASLDIDVDLLASDLAPAPDLLQRLGRQWRFGDSPERAARAGSTQRVFRVVAVRQDDRVTERGALPYPASMLARTYAWLAALTRPLDVLADSQNFVDAAYRPLTEAEIQEAEREIARESVRTFEAGRARSNLTGLLRRDFYEVTWSDLVSLAEYDDEEALMRTRYIDVDTVPVLLFDSTGTHAPLDNLPAGGVETLRSARGAKAAELLGASLHLPGHLRPRVEAASGMTLGLNNGAWAPESKMLAGFLPVDMRHLDACTYDSLTGFRSHKEGA